MFPLIWESEGKLCLARVYNPLSSCFRSLKIPLVTTPLFCFVLNYVVSRKMSVHNLSVRVHGWAVWPIGQVSHPFSSHREIISYYTKGNSETGYIYLYIYINIQLLNIYKHNINVYQCIKVKCWLPHWEGSSYGGANTEWTTSGRPLSSLVFPTSGRPLLLKPLHCCWVGVTTTVLRSTFSF